MNPPGFVAVLAATIGACFIYRLYIAKAYTNVTTAG